MNIFEIKRTMIDKGIPAEVIEQFVFPKTEDEALEDKFAFAKQMDKLLSKEQILMVMEEQGCNKNAPTAEYIQKFEGKSIEERIDILNSMGIDKEAKHRLNDDGTLSIFWHFEEKGKYICVCPIMSNLSEPTTVSLTFCGCCSGHVKYHCEFRLGVKLRLLETVSSPLNSNGRKYCEHRFEIIEK
jgi:hypothetical protein